MKFLEVNTCWIFLKCEIDFLWFFHGVKRLLSLFNNVTFCLLILVLDLFLNQDKRKASADNLMPQPPLKKIAMEGRMGAMRMNSMQVDVQGATAGFPSAVGGSSLGVSSIPRQLPNENFPGRQVGGQMVKTSSVLAQAWKEDMDAGHLLASLFEYFGESVFSYAPKSELSFFLWLISGDLLLSRMSIIPWFTIFCFYDVRGYTMCTC